MNDMKKIFILIISLLFIGCSEKAEAQSKNAEPYSFPVEHRTRNVGSAGKMEGNILLITVFVRKKGEQDFTETEKSNYYSSLNKAIAWLEGKANQYGGNVKFVSREVTETMYVSSSFNFKTAWPRHIFQEAFGNFDYNDFFLEEQKKYGCNGYIVLVYTNQNEKCNYSTCADGLSGYITEACVFTPNTFNNFTSVIAHEILHTFGAIDIYSVDFSKTKYEYGNRFNSSIMLIANEDLKKLYIDDVNAYLIGISDDYQAWYYDIVTHLR